MKYLALIGLVVCLMGCSETEEPDIWDLCEESDTNIELALSTEPSISLTQQGAISGQIQAGELRLYLGDVYQDQPSEAILRFADTRTTQDLLDVLTQSELEQFQLRDITTVEAGAESRSSLQRYSCAISDGTLCAQLGIDANANRRISDDDFQVHNARGGFFEIDVQNIVSRIILKFEVTLGSNILRSADVSEGTIRGCARLRYQSSLDGWTLASP